MSVCDFCWNTMSSTVLKSVYIRVGTKLLSNLKRISHSQSILSQTVPLTKSRVLMTISDSKNSFTEMISATSKFIPGGDLYFYLKKNHITDCLEKFIQCEFTFK